MTATLLYSQGPDERREELRRRYNEVRAFTLRLCEPLRTEDYVVQSMPDVSPTRWHLAHTAWFFETFVLARAFPGEAPFHPAFEMLFNSYYNAVGEPFPRPRRGLLSRPTVEEVLVYRAHVDERMARLFAALSVARWLDLADLIELGLHHEQQHQELMLTDILHVFAQNPLQPRYHDSAPLPAREAEAPRWINFPGGLVQIGHLGEGFAFDNEGPRHKVWTEPFALADRMVTAGEFAAFVENGGYARPEWWLSEGWATVKDRGWTAPMYWERVDGVWSHFTHSGLIPLDPHRPVRHLSFFEADAFARWSGARLPTEAEWEVAAADQPVRGRFVEDGEPHTTAAPEGESGVRQMFGDAWEWTASPYAPYPGFAPAPGAVGEYNGKFMCNQMVLRGGSFGSSVTHLRATYRNFFPPDARWQFTGLRLARGVR